MAATSEETKATPKRPDTLKKRRRHSSLGADPRGDTGGSAIATSNLKQTTPPASPVSAHPPTKEQQRERGRKRKKAKRLLSRWKRTCLKHTWLLPLILTLTILALYAVSPGEHNPLHPAIFLSYADPPHHERTHTLPTHIGNVTQYGKGPKDFAFVAFYTIVLSFTREFLMQRLIRPIALRCGIRNRAKQSRFMEQFYTAIYFGIFGPFGIFVMSRTPVWYFNTAGMYAGFPHRAHEAYFKAYYLLQGAYWAQQGLVLLLQLEKPRKDFRELVLHHIITLALIGLSYRFHFTYMGVAVYITHDVSDFFLATSKVLNYIDSPLTPPYFVFFIGVWAYLRHFINLRILYSLFPYALPLLSPTTLPPALQNILPSSLLAKDGTIAIFGPPNEFATVGSYTLDWPTQQYKCWISQAITFALLASLQAVNMFWFFLILRILARFVTENVAKDERSDDEDDGEEETNGHAKGPGEAPRVMVNGEPISPVDGTGLEVSERKRTLRKR